MDNASPGPGPLTTVLTAPVISAPVKNADVLNFHQPVKAPTMPIPAGGSYVYVG
jgi:hypothetical protein